MIYGKLATSVPSGYPVNALPLLTDIHQRQPQTWSDGSTDVPLSRPPSGYGPYGYDAANQVAIPNPGFAAGQQQDMAKGHLMGGDTENLKLRSIVRELLAMNNQIVAFLTANAAVLNKGSLPTTRTWAQALASIKTRIATETDPAS